MRRAFLLILVLGTCAVAATPARAAVAITGPGGFLAGFVPPVVVTAPGEEITYANGDIAPHNLIALDAFVPKRVARKVKWCSAYDKGKCPLFWSETIGLGEATDVLGVERLESGRQYAFYCSLHPNMKGTLIVR